LNEAARQHRPAILALHNATQNELPRFRFQRPKVLIRLILQGFTMTLTAILRDGTLTAKVAFMKRTLLLFAVLAVLASVAGCGQSNSSDNTPAADTNTAAQSAGDTTSNAWQDTKGAASNAWNSTKDEATNVWNKTTNAVKGGGS
jgi:predicted small lipoprotein YifL